MYILDDKMFRQRYNADEPEGFVTPAGQSQTLRCAPGAGEQNVRHAMQLGMQSYTDKPGANRLYMEEPLNHSSSNPELGRKHYEIPTEVLLHGGGQSGDQSAQGAVAGFPR
jgi:hypothetical protein